MNEGDIYRWSWKRNKKECGTEYWAMSCIAVVKNGVLRDTWDVLGNGKMINPDKVDLRFVANMSDLVKISEYEYPNRSYHPRDIVDLNHSNSTRGNLYIRKDAKKSIEVMSQFAEEVVKHSEYELLRAEQTLEESRDQLAKLSTDSYLRGDPDMYFHYVEE